MNIDLNKYKEFVQEVTSEESQNLTSFMIRLDRLDGNYEAYGPDGEYMHGPSINVPLLLCGAIGLGSETGEFQEIVKKCVFQGKPLSEDTKFHMKRELGDIMWYWVNACRALDLDPNEVVAENVTKLKSRYPGGEFDVHYSENRKEGDL
jgi:NTP pyrophosphatase (non-canonical NTP hydrolase)